MNDSFVGTDIQRDIRVRIPSLFCAVLTLVR